MARLPNPVVVVPGIIASYLRDQYTIPPELIWTVLTKTYERAGLHPDDLQLAVPLKGRAYEAVQPSRVVADQVYEIAYKELIEELRHNLTEKQDAPVPVFPFGYDWRQPLEAIQDELADFIREVGRRTALLRHYFKQGYADDPRVNLVGHSMGGLVIAGCLAKHGMDLKVGKVVTLGTPYRGSFESIVKVATGTANLGNDVPSSRERESARVTPALYYLTPSLPGVKIDPALPQTDLFDPDLWQQSIIDSIAEYIRLHGRQAMNATERNEMARQVLAAMLAAAKGHRATTADPKLAAAGLTADDWLCIAGVNAETRVQVSVGKFGRDPAFVFAAEDKANNWGDPDPATALRTGDGTVPLEGAVPAFLPRESVVCVTPDDFSRLGEIGDRLLLKAVGFHGMLPNLNMAQKMIVRFFTGWADPHGNTWGRALPGVAAGAWAPPLDLGPPKPA